ncbi:MAG: helix-turn-helix domain-containing protein [Calothrix sp. MO_167.B12]|nr:helix-turn-helix domain-containing protein [Calothrix sp. MO_167.B12]
MTSTYSFSIPGNSTIEVSKDELRSLLGEIEAELHRSKSYRRALASLQKLLGESSELAQVFFKVVSREAIGLAFRQFALHSQQVNDSKPDVETNAITDNNSNGDGELNETVTSVKLYSQVSSDNQKVQNSSLELPAKTNSPESISHQDATPKTKRNLFKWHKKPSPAELQQIASQQRLEKLNQIGQQLRQARESQGLSLSQLGVYTHIPMYHMESIEKGYIKSLPDDVFVRGFIRTMGNTLGLDGDSLAASLPNNAHEKTEFVLPSTYQPQKSIPSTSRQLRLELSPVHLYMGYTALVAGAVGGLSLMSGQSATENKVFSDSVKPSTQSFSDSFRHREANAKPGIQSSNGSVNVGIDIAPPEAL